MEKSFYFFLFNSNLEILFKIDEYIEKIKHKNYCIKNNK